MINFNASSDTGNLIIATNDDTSITDSEREAKLTKLFASIGITVKFED